MSNMISITEYEAEILYKQIAAGESVDKETIVDLLQYDAERLTQAMQAKALVDIATIQDEIDELDTSPDNTDYKAEVQLLNSKLTHMRWMAERLLPKIFGSKQQIEVIDKVKIQDTQIDEIVQSAAQKVIENAAIANITNSSIETKEES